MRVEADLAVVCVGVLGASLGLAAPAAADGTTAVLTLSGEIPPGTDFAVTPFGAPVLNDAGTVAFVASPVSGPGAGSPAVYVDSVAGPLSLIAQNGQTPNGSATPLSTTFNFTQINASGQVAFGGLVTSPFEQAIIQGSGGAVPGALVLGGTTEPTGNGTFSSITGVSQGVTLGDGGHVGFPASLSGVTGGAGTNGLYRVDSSGTVVEIARQGQAVPGGDGVFEGFFGGGTNDGVSVNASGLVAFRAEIDASSDGNANDTAVYTSDGTTITELIRDGDDTALANTRFTDVRFVPALNDAGQTAFEIGLTGSAVTSSTNEAVYRTDGVTHTQIARKGDAPPDGNGVFFDFIGTTINLGGGGDVSFIADVTGTAGGGSDNRGLYVGDGTTLTRVAREGDAVPGGNGTFTQFLTQPVVNDDGQVAFLTSLIGTSGGAADSEAIYFYDPTEGLEEVVRRGDSLAGGTITDLNFAQNLQRNTANAGSGLNNEDQLAFHFTLDNGTRGVGLWTFEAAAAVVAGDYNGDGFVSQADLDLVLLNWGDAVAPAGFVEAALVGGGPFDGLISQNELDGVLLNWGNGTPPAPGSVNAIPEPASALGLGGLLWLTTRTRRAVSGRRSFDG